MIQQSHAPMDSGEVEGEVEGSDDQIGELSGARKPRRDEKVNTSKRTGSSPGEHRHREGTKRRDADNGHDKGKNQKKKKRAFA